MAHGTQSQYVNISCMQRRTISDVIILREQHNISQINSSFLQILMLTMSKHTNACQRQNLPNISDTQLMSS